VNAGYSFANTKLSAGGVSLRGIGSDGPTVGVTGGFDYQFAPRWVGGVALDANLDGVNSKLDVAGAGTVAKIEDQWSWAARARLGYLTTPSTMLYLTAGWSWLHSKTSTILPGFNASHESDGPVVGAGFETHLAGGWFLHGEYLYTFLNSYNSPLAPGLKVEPRTQVARLGLTYKIGLPGFGPGFVPEPVPQRANWTGFFIGLQGGYGMANTTADISGAGKFRGLGSDGVFGGLIAGYDYQVAPRIVLGAEADVSASNIDSEISGVGADVKASNDWDWSVRGRAGYLITPGTMLFAAVGYDAAHVKLSGIPNFSWSSTLDGVQFGGGIETALTDHISLRAEYLHTLYGSKTVFGPISIKPSAGKARIGITYKFGSPAPAVVAKY
jgi:outer membrane immunogenic protein